MDTDRRNRIRDDFVLLASLDPYLIMLAHYARLLAQRYGANQQDFLWRFAVKPALQLRVGWLAPKDAAPELRTLESYDIAGDYLLEVLRDPTWDDGSWPSGPESFGQL